MLPSDLGSKALHLSEPQFPDLQSRDNNTYLKMLLSGLNEMAQVA